MYRRKHISLDEAVEVIAERLATYSNGLSGIEDARGQLIEALYDGAIRSEGVSWVLVEPDPCEPEPVIPPGRTNIPRPHWKNENYKTTMPLFSHSSELMSNTHTDRYGRITSTLDAVTV